MTLRHLSLLLILCSAVACGSKSPTDPSQGLNVPFTQTDLVVGTGRQAANGNVISVNYTLWLYDGTKPDNKGVSLQTGTLQPFTLGGGSVIRGFDQGVVGMAVGGKRRLIIPPDLAYGSQGGGNGSIPPNATIIFEVELLSIQ